MHLEMEEIAGTISIIYDSHRSYIVVNDPSVPVGVACSSVASADGNSKPGFLWLNKLRQAIKAEIWNEHLREVNCAQTRLIHT